MEQSKYDILCPFCKKAMRWIDNYTYTPTCACISGKYVRCGEQILETDFKEHFVKRSKNSGKVTPAAAIPAAARVFGYDVAAQPNLGAAWEEYYRSLGMVRKAEIIETQSRTNAHLAAPSEFQTSSPRKPAYSAPTLCSYCKKAFVPRDISSHEEKCLDKPIKCPECSDIVLVRKWYEHECQKTKPKVESCTLASSSLFRENKLFHDFKEFFLIQEDCDVVIRVQGQEFHAHKAILKARSPVLASTFRNDMKEKKTGIVEIEDCDPSSFPSFLCFLYCGDTDVISKENVFSLYTVADKYDVQDLKETCVEFMTKNLSVDTFCETITLALRHWEAKLIKLTTDFFVENAKEITLTAKWQSFLAENPTESNELIVKFIASK